MMVSILNLLETFYISHMLEISLMRLCSFCPDLAAGKRQMFSSFAMRSLNCVATATLLVTSRHNDHALSPRTLAPRAISRLSADR